MERSEIITNPEKEASGLSGEMGQCARYAGSASDKRHRVSTTPHAGDSLPYAHRGIGLTEVIDQ